MFIEKLGVRGASALISIITTICLWMSLIESFTVSMINCIINQITFYFYIYSMTAFPQLYIASKYQRMIALCIISVFYLQGDNVLNFTSTKLSDKDTVVAITYAVAIISSLSSLGLILNKQNKDEKSNSQIFMENNIFSLD